MIAIGEAARRSGVSIETIRYYEREGIVPRPERAANGRRAYSAQEVGRLRLIRRCRDLGFDMADARMLLALAEQTEADCAKVHRVANAQLAEVRARIGILLKMEAALEELAANCAAGQTLCPMLERLKED